ncbi:EscU/YscU/HrcU family type III secretion system export apparatus switch protein [Phyllobacterium sp. 21LDTY02-6]|uniref:EscU/YscU/HrcU family type III secretion system export apparatus switch protein n=1 Tax=unclassified Phyllobacterium TaxID=2638441 RepID=UPI00201FC5B4|nr:MULTISPECIES: EscU/YscU/HrcU family type III secretion system export apparatus switch protein [unclassified Phyllobacterium]MCO4318285.1 EscU/YscU/HrcU family type III secretion system export apparatus switch protein [Phyllobacterium sp. 21LDTY02-6]MCX8280280.1 EscU/YscU/HrcU family type III secretion system export apparatus switch protein [Phyllobacterium sp. 0TCS1.6C]MCX8294159.1 EscU/YscU/HrcU family type III secretion system export apparatus switch protein [Phyllobacterium sp. 0TCS1.6A]
MSQTSEEKSLPASDKKIEDARKKGQVLHSPDMVSGVIMLSCTIFLIYIAPVLRESISALVEEASHIYDRPFDEVWHRLSIIAVQSLLTATLPILAITIAAIVATNVAVTRGFVFSAKPVEPDFDRINPMTGIKRIFSLKSVVEFVKALIKIIALTTAFVLVFQAGLKALFESPFCGAFCLQATFFAMLKPLAAVAVAAFLVLGFIDIFLQRWLFLREMRMTKTESKREHKDMEGDPLIRQERQRRRRAGTGAKTGLKHAVLLIGDPARRLVGIRYVRGETPVPVVVCRSSGAEAAAMHLHAAELGIPVTVDAALAEQIAATGAGQPVPERAFQPVANALVAAGLI